MATISELDKKNLDTNEVGGVMPSRAKYYYNSNTTDFNEIGDMRTAPRTRYDGFVLNNVADKAIDINKLNIANTDLRTDLEKGNPDLLPSSATLRMLNDKYKAPEKPFESDAEVSFKLNSKGKFIFAVYAVLVLSLVLIIVLNAIAVNRQVNFNAQLKNDISLSSENYLNLTEQSNKLADEQRIYNAAINYGMTESKAVKVKLDIPAENQNVTYARQTNWFDRLCDLFS